MGGEKYRKKTCLMDSLARLCSDGDVVHLYYITDNSRVYHKEELKSFEIKPEVLFRVSVNVVFSVLKI